MRDEKILSGWNGLTIAALGRGFAITGKEEWRAAAVAAVAAIRGRLVDRHGRLLRCAHAGVAAIPAFLEDYAFYVWGLIELYQATLREEFLDDALQLSKEMLRLFAAPDGGLYSVGSDADDLPLRMQSAVDGVIPAGTGILRSQMGSIQQQPLSHLFSLCTLDFLHGPPLEITLHGGTADQQDTIVHSVAQRFLPNLVLRRGRREGELQINVCAEGSCRPPLADLAELEALLDELA
ncbi:MAG: thioredoxin domain-containing protein [Desulfuromonadales bacterium]|nr:thioredoxin domain-containing protein [Desulfuromonadales bacterium]